MKGNRRNNDVKNVAQPPSAVLDSKCLQSFYKRNLPHLQSEERSYFITFTTWKRWILPPEARDLVCKHVLFDRDKKYCLHGFVVMPDHVHVVMTPLIDHENCIFSLAEILGGIKGASAHGINGLLARCGHVWQDESFDHILRSDECIRRKVEYICENPVRKRLVGLSKEYRWLWREWVEGLEVNTAGGGCATNSFDLKLASFTRKRVELRFSQNIKESQGI